MYIGNAVTGLGLPPFSSCLTFVMSALTFVWTAHNGNGLVDLFCVL